MTLRFRIVKKSSYWAIQTWYDATNNQDGYQGWHPMMTGLLTLEEATRSLINNWNGVVFQSETAGTFQAFSK